MERMSCSTRGCGAIYPDYARFCPRCGNANPRVMSTFDRSRPPRSERVAANATKSIRLQRERGSRALRFGVLMTIVAVCMIGKFNSHHRQVNAELRQPAEIDPSWYRGSGSDYRAYQSRQIVAPVADVSTLTAFQTQLAIGFVNEESHNQWQQQIVGQRVHWTGYVFTPSDGIGSPALANNMEPGTPLVHLQTASREAKNKLRQIPDGSKVQVDGVLMDDHWIHVIDVSRTW